MKNLLLMLFSLTLAVAAFADTGEFDRFAGFYKGKMEIGGDGVFRGGYPVSMYPEIYAEVYRAPKSEYRLRIFTQIFSRAETTAELCNLREIGGEIPFEFTGYFALKGAVKEGAFSAKGRYAGNDYRIKFERVRFESPTLGKRAPKGAVALFDGSRKSLSDNWVVRAKPELPVCWEIKDGATTVKSDLKKPDGKRLSGSLETRRGFGKCELHLEFNIPAMYEQTDQWRANSGVMFGPYEVQILDSFGADGTWQDCGALYRQTPPQVNASLEPGAWQTYDIVFSPARFDGGKCVELPKMTVYHNGKRVQFETPIPYATTEAPTVAPTYKHPEGKLKIQLQDHLNPVRFRNIWVRELD